MLNYPQTYRCIMHHKFCLIDGDVPEFGRLWFGSLNLTLSALSNNWENITVTSDPCVIARFSEEFHLLWDHLSEQ